jgi:hypothetical protein
VALPLADRAVAGTVPSELKRFWMEMERRARL